MPLDPENVEYILRSRLHFSTSDLEKYPIDRGIRMVKRAMVDSIVLRPDTYLRRFADIQPPSSKRDLKGSRSFKAILPKTWVKE